MKATLTLGDGFVAIRPFPETLLPKLRYWKRSLVFNQRTHRREMQATGETLYRVEEGAAEDGTPSRTCITLPGFAKRCKDHLVSCGWGVDVVDSRTPMPEPDIAKAMTGLREYQYELVYDMLMSGGGVMAGATGCHAKGERVLCADGHAMAVEDVRIGDRLLGHDGTPRTVVALHHGVKPCWRVVPVKGDPFVVTEDHMLTLVRTRRRAGKDSLADELVDVTVKDWMAWGAWRKHLHKLVRSGGVDFGASETTVLPIPPYVLGVLIGDGCFSGSIDFTSMDKEVVAEMGAYVAKNGWRMATRPAGKATTYLIRFGNQGKRTEAPLRATLRRLGLLECRSGSKFVPHEYLTASRHDRLELLAGLIDADGYVANNTYDYVTKSGRLADDMAFLCRSLGLAAHVAKCRKGIRATGFTGDYWRLSISGDTSAVHCRIPRRKCAPRAQKKSVLRSGFTVEPVGDREYFGFTVDGDNRYLLPDFTITHNCGKTHIMKALCNAYPHEALMARGTPTVVVAVPDKDITRKNFNDLTELLPDRKVGLVMSGSRNFSDDVQVITLDSLHLLNADDVGVLIVDEMHTASSDTRASELLRFTKARTWGVSATPDGRFDGKDVVAEGIFGPVVARFSYADGVRAGCLVPITVYWLDCPEPNIGLDCYLRYKTRDQRYRWGVYDNRLRNQLVGRVFAGIPRDMQALGMLQFTKHMEKVLRGCASAGCNPMPTQVHAGTDAAAFPPSSFWHVKAVTAKERKAIYADMRSGAIRQAVATHVWKQGVDFPGLSVVVNVGGGGSEIVSQQVPGRASRKVDGKDRAYIVEFRHGWDVTRGKSGRETPGPVLRDDESRRKIYEELGFEQISLENERGLPWMSSSGSPTP